VFENTPAVTTIDLGCCRNITGKNIPAPFFRRPVRRRCFRVCSPGDIKVFENTPAVTTIDLGGCRNITGKKIPASFLSGPAR
jgi:hypothetical protein